MKKATNTKKQSEDNPAGVLVAAMANPDGHITSMEKRGQEEFIESDVFPVDLCGTPKKFYEDLGFKFHGVVQDDDIFQYVTIPSGWRREPTGHDMWSNIVDQDDVVRVQIFYKAAFYDRSAYARLTNEEE